MMKKLINSTTVILLTLCLFIFGCQQEYIKGIKSTDQSKGKVYFPASDSINNSLISLLDEGDYRVDTIQKTIDFFIPVYRGGFMPTQPFTVDVSADNSSLSDLINSADLPANTVALDPKDYILSSTDTLSANQTGMVSGKVVVKVKVSSLQKYNGKVAALGLQISNPSKYSINENMDKVTIYFPVDEVVGKIYYPAFQEKNNALLSVYQKYEFDSASDIISYAIPIKRAGFAGLDDFTVQVSVNHDAVTDLINSGRLPTNTVSLSANEYEMNNSVTLSPKNGEMEGEIIPKIKANKLRKYSGKKVALGLTLSKSSKFVIDPQMNTVVIYFDVDSMLNDILPAQNLIKPSAWKVLNIAGNDNVQITFNQDSSSITYTGGNNGHMAVYQAVQVKANRDYEIDMDVKGSGATDTWFEAYVNPAAPNQGQDYTDGKLISLNTWSGCGNTPFNGLLSKLSCDGPGNIISFTNSETVYVLIKSGGADLGSSGITISNIVFKRVQ